MKRLAVLVGLAIPVLGSAQSLDAPSSVPVVTTSAPRGALFLHGIFKVGVIVDDFDATIAALRSRGVNIEIGPFPKRLDQPANAIIRDNAGNYIQIFGK